MARKKAIELQKPGVIQFFWRWHDTSQTDRRVWRSDWAFDQWEMLNLAAFAKFELTMRRFGFRVSEVDDED